MKPLSGSAENLLDGKLGSFRDTNIYEITV
jgi:hypothetical protein